MGVLQGWMYNDSLAQGTNECFDAVYLWIYYIFAILTTEDIYMPSALLTIGIYVTKVED